MVNFCSLELIFFLTVGYYLTCSKLVAFDDCCDIGRLRSGKVYTGVFAHDAGCIYLRSVQACYRMMRQDLWIYMVLTKTLNSYLASCGHILDMYRS